MATDYSDRPERSDALALSPVTRVLRERWWLILAAGVVGLAIGIAIAVTTSKSYTATAKLLVQPESQVGNAILQSQGSTEDPTRIAATDLLLMTSSAVAEGARKRLGFTTPASELAGQVTASEEPNSDLYDITATSSDPARAAKIANAFAEEFVTFSQQTSTAGAIAAQKALQARLAALPASDTTDAAALHDALQRIIGLGAVQAGTASVVGTAGIPTTPASPKPKLDAALGLVIGLAFGLGLAFLLDLADRRIKDAEGFEAVYGLRTLARVPPRSLAVAGADPRAPTFEPFRVLAGALRFSRATSGVRSLVVTSAVAGEGKTTVAVGLAKALASSGLDVILVEMDHRRPSLSSYFRLRPGGVTTVITGRGTLAGELQKPDSGLPSLRVLPTGPHIAMSSLELLRSPEMDELMAQLLELSDIVIYDTPPIVGIADTQALMDHPRLDAALIVGGANRVTREEAKRARTILDQRVVRPLGLVITGLEEPGAASDYYYYAPDASDGVDGSPADVRLTSQRP